MAEAKKPVDPQKEIEILVGELEERVDRLRAMYEQYFMGYEKIEPGVARKDVDRRFTFLRKSQIRNTALRFRFNVVTQKFNTYSMYWTRICRQIEEGTFKRHIQKANRRFGQGAGREQDFSIDVDLGEFDDMMGEDGELAMARVLAEAEAVAAPPEVDETKKSNLGYERDDTAKNQIEQNVTEAPPPKSFKPAARPPAQAFVLDADGADTVPPPSTGSGTAAQQRIARHAVLPAGTKQRMLVKRPGGPSSSQAQPSSSQPQPSSSQAQSSQPQPSSTRTEPAPPSAPELTPPPTTAGVRGPMPSAPERAPPSTSVIRAASPQGHVHRSPPGVMRPGISPHAQSVQRVQIAKVQPPSDTQPPPSMRPPQPSANPTPAASTNRVPAAQPAPSTNRVPAAQPAASTNRVPAASTNRVPAASTNRVPAEPAAASSQRAPAAAPAASTNRIPAAPAVPGAPRTQVGLPSGGSVGRMPVSAGTMPPPAPPQPPPIAPRPAPAAASERKIPIPPPSQRTIPARPGGAMPAAAPVRAPSPSVPDVEKSPPSRRPPPMLPSQVKKG